MVDQQDTAVGVPLGKPLDESAVQEFAANFRGDLIRPDDEGYDAARAVYNAMIDRRPAVIARCSGVADVIAAVNFARENELVVAVRGGGHSVPGYGVCDGGIVIDLSPMKGIWVDPASRTARAQAGVTWGEFDRETQQFGLATTGGRVTHTGISGLTLGSGSGWLERKYGLTCDNLVSAEVVTAGGEFLKASETENEDLFWGLRGGGGNFGVVTSFEYRLHDVGPIVLGGMLMFPFSRAAELVRFWRDHLKNAPDELGGAPAFLTAPPAPFVPEHLKGQLVAGLIVCYAGPPEEGEEWVRPLKDFGPPEVDLVQPMPYTVLQTLVDPANPPGRRNYWKAENMAELSDEAIDIMVDQASKITSPFSVVLLEPEGARDWPGQRGRDGDRRSGRGLHDLRVRDVGGSGRDGCPRRLGARVYGGDGTLHHPRRLPELQQRPEREQGQVLLQIRQVRTAGRPEEKARPDEPVPPQPEHQARVERLGPLEHLAT